jgi:peptidoglycan/LPS O-acetylase OafA/YrhL
MPGLPLTADALAVDPRSGRRSFAFRPDVEGLRAVAIAAVVGYHVGLPLFSGGFVGVDVFFVISGFLITGLLVQEATATGHVSLARFWARRARRLLPAATLVLVVVAVASWFAVPAIDHETTGYDITASALYVANVRFAFQATDYLASDAAPSPVLHFWSLGVEEQFYVVWPLLIIATAAFVTWRRRTPTSQSARRTVSRGPLAVVLAVLGIASFLLSLRLTARIEPWAFFSMPTRAWEFAIGGLVSIGAVELVRLPIVARWAIGWGGGAALLASIVLLTNELPYPGTAALWPVLATAAVIAAGDAGGRPAGVGAVLSWVPMRALGRLSYSWYLWHWPFLVLAASVWGDLSVLGKSGLALLALVPSALAFRFVERPLHHLPSLVASSARSLRLGAALSAGAALAGVALALGSGGGALASGLVVPVGADEQTGRGPAALAPSDSPTPKATGGSPSAKPTSAAVVWPTGALTPTPAKARADVPVVYADGCHLSPTRTTYPTCAFGDTSSATTVFLLGDSHAAQWFPTMEAIATKEHWRLLSRTKSGCPAPDVTIFNKALKRAYDECDTWRAGVLAEIAATNPALVVAAGTRTDSLVDRASGRRLDASTAGAEWQAGWSRTLAALEKDGVATAVLRDTPWPGRDVPSCVQQHSARPSACDLSRSALDAAAYDIGMVKGVSTAHAVDLSALLCDARRCPVTRGKYLVYRDTSHLTATFAAALTPYLGAKLVPLVG